VTTRYSEILSVFVFRQIPVGRR